MSLRLFLFQHQDILNKLYELKISSSLGAVSKEIAQVRDLCKYIKDDFRELSSIGNLNLIYTDFIIRDKKKLIKYEHVILKNNVIYILERRKTYLNQRKLLARKTKILRKLTAGRFDVRYFVISDNTSVRKRLIRIEDFKSLIKNSPSNEDLCDVLGVVLDSKILPIDAREYMKLKYDVNIDLPKSRKTTSVKIIKFVFPFITQYSTKVGFLSSLTLFLFAINSILHYISTYNSNLKWLSLLLSLFYFIVLLYILKEMEARIPKKLSLFIFIPSISFLLYVMGQFLSYM